MSKIIKDTIYGFITIEGVFEELVDSVPFQRLRYIKQLGFSYLVYPTAEHSRFEHSLGSFYLADKIVKEKKFEDENEFKIAALLHDVGHLPFSHALEELVEYYNQKNHERYTIELIKNSEISKILDKYKINTAKVIKFVKGEGKLGQLISGAIDVDRLDYLKRDAYHTGVAYGVIDQDVIIKSLKIQRGGISIDLKYVPAFESILIARYMMYPTVYNHHATRIAVAMARRAMQELTETNRNLYKKLVFMDDIDIISLLRNSSGKSSELIKRIDKRELYKRALILKKEKFKKIAKILTLRNNPEKIKELEDKISQRVGLNVAEILIDIPPEPEFIESKIKIFEKDISLEKFSPLVKSLIEAEWNYWYVGVYCKKELKEKVQRAEKEIIDMLND